MKRMTATSIKKETRVGVYRCDPSLFVRIYTGGSKSFIQKLTLADGRRIEIGLGGFDPNIMSLDEVREIAFENRRIVRRGGDPRRAKTTKHTEVPTFAACADGWFADKRDGWSEASAKRAWARIEAHALPALGNCRVDTIDQPAIIDLLAPIFKDKFSTGKTLRQSLSAVFKWAIAKNIIAHDPAGASISPALPSAAVEREHRTAIPHDKLAAALDTIDQCRGPSVAAKLAVRLCALTALRSGEVAGARWSEIDMEAREWTVPAARMKGRRAAAHRVPISDAAMSVLRQARKLGDGDVVFPTRRGTAIGTRDLLRAVQAAGLHDEMSIHGMRSSFRVWADEIAEAEFSVMEFCLSHAVGDSTVRAYARSDLFDRRRRLMEDWGRYLCGNLVNLDAARKTKAG